MIIIKIIIITIKIRILTLQINSYYFNVIVNVINPLVPDAHYSERRDKLASLQYRYNIFRSQSIKSWRIFL